MKVESMANAGFVITLADGRTLVTDPWLSGGAYYGSWYNYPPVSEELRDHYTSSRPTWIYVSHIHPDHLDPATLRMFPEDTPVLIGRLPHQHLRRALLSIGFSDVIELPLDETQTLDGVDMTILSQFAAAAGGYEDDVDYAMDTSLVLRDADGALLLNLVDNAADVESAHRLQSEFGRPDIAILPYSGASLYPHAFAYTDEDKDQRTLELRERTMAMFVGLAEAVGPRFAVPAAGSYVMGGRLAPWTRWLHQAAPAQIRQAWTSHPPASTELRQLGPGEVLDSDTGTVTRPNPNQAEFTPEQRLHYAMTLADRPLPHDQIQIPPAFDFPWPRLLATARANLWRVQTKRGLFRAVDIELHIQPSDGVRCSTTRFVFSLDSEHPNSDPHRARVTFTIEAALLLMILTGAAIWNNVEIGALVQIERSPDTYDPTVHSLMSYFTLAG